MELGWAVFMVILSIVGVVLLLYVIIWLFGHIDIGVTAPTPVDDALEKENCKRELLGYSPIVKDTLTDKEQDDHFVKCFDMGPIATDPIPDDILKSLNGIKIIKIGRIPKRYKTVFSTVCPKCNSEFVFEFKCFVKLENHDGKNCHFMCPLCSYEIVENYNYFNPRKIEI